MAEPSFLKVVSLVHRSTPTNGTCLLLVIFRSLAMRNDGQETIPLPKQDDDSATTAATNAAVKMTFEEEEESHNSCILTVEHFSEKGKLDIKFVGERQLGDKTNDTKSSDATGDGKPGIANNRTIVLILTFLQNLAKNGSFVWLN